MTSNSNRKRRETFKDPHGYFAGALTLAWIAVAALVAVFLLVLQSVTR